jgi:phosphopantothenoylcysteine synthetase/decarboxylase
MKILVVYGGTEEPLDGVRSITNFSTGETGATLCENLSLNHEVSALKAKRVRNPRCDCSTSTFVTYQQLSLTIQKILSESYFDMVIMAAAVSDYSVDHLLYDGEIVAVSQDEKLSSGGSLSVHLRMNDKIVERLKAYSLNRAIKVVAFKLTHSLDQESNRHAVSRLLNSTAIDYVIHNDLHSITEQTHGFSLYGNVGMQFRGDDKRMMAEALDCVARGIL